MEYKFDRILKENDTVIIQKLHEIIDKKFFATIPFSPIKNIASESELVDVTECKIYTIEADTRFRERRWEKFTESYRGQDVGDTPKLLLQQIPIWDVFKDETEDFHHNIYQTARKLECITCHAKGRVTCDQCHGKGLVVCSSCNGSGKNKCNECNGARQVKCSSCRGSGTRTERRTEQYKKTCTACQGKMFIAGKKCWACELGQEIAYRDNLYDVPCIRCNGSGKNTCSTCGGNGDLTCSQCNGAGRLTCSQCNGDREITCSICDGQRYVVNGFALTQNDWYRQKTYTQQDHEKNDFSEFVIPTCFPNDSPKTENYDPNENIPKTYWGSPILMDKAIISLENDGLIDDIPIFKGDAVDSIHKTITAIIASFPIEENIRYYKQKISIYSNSMYLYRFKLNKLLSSDEKIHAFIVDLDAMTVKVVSELLSDIVTPLKKDACDVFNEKYLTSAFIKAIKAKCVSPDDSEIANLLKKINAQISLISCIPIIVISAGILLTIFYVLKITALNNLMWFILPSFFIIWWIYKRIFFNDLFYRCYGRRMQLLFPAFLIAILIWTTTFAAVGNIISGVVIAAVMFLILGWRILAKRDYKSIMSIKIPTGEKLNSMEHKKPVAAQRYLKVEPDNIVKRLNSLMPHKGSTLAVWFFIIFLIVFTVCVIWHDSRQNIREYSKRIIIQYSDSETKYQFGIALLNGIGYAKNNSDAAVWIKKAADEGHVQAQYELGNCYFTGTGFSRNDSHAVDYYKMAASKGLSVAQNKLGDCFARGVAGKVDMQKAFTSYRLAAAQNYSEAQFNVAMCYLDGKGVDKNLLSAFEYFTQAAKNGFKIAKYHLGRCYEYGLGTNIEYTKALAYYADVAIEVSEAQKGQARLKEIGKWWALAVNNDAQAQYNVGICYFDGNGVKKDLIEAYNWFSKSAGGQNADGIVAVADCHFYGYGISKDIPSAVATFKKMAQQKHRYAQFRLGSCYEQGIVVEQNLSTAGNLYSESMNQGYINAESALKRIVRISKVWDDAIKNHNATAQLELGKCYESGDGITQSDKLAFSCFWESAKQENPEAMYLAAIYYESGKGSKKDLKSAIELLKKSAAKEYVPAIFELAMKYKLGDGVERNLTTSHDLFARSAQAGYKNSSQLASELKTIALYWTPAIEMNDRKAQYMLAHCYMDGNGIDQDLQKAYELLKKSSDQGYPDALYEWAVNLSKSAKTITEKQNIATLLTKAADANHGEAIVMLGILYYSGDGVEENYDKSIELWTKAVAQKNANAMYQLGKHRLHGRGFFNSGKNINKAIELFIDAAELGQPEAILCLDEYFRDKDKMFSLQSDTRKLLIAYYAKAASFGHLDAMYKYGRALYEGDFVDKDIQTGSGWMQKAADSGYLDAQKFISGEKLFK